MRETRVLPYALTAVGLVVGLLVLQVRPFPTTGLNYLVGGVALAVAVGSVAYMIVAHGDPGERGPDF
ncbi:MAG: hypothetical protein ABEI96_07010 [Haloarculaceae archaeon]